jgi:acyl-CoA synthetase (AMP-forming)/AMP-acid ligase II
MQPLPATLSGALQAAAAKWPDKPFLRDGSTVVTFAQLREASDLVACGLLRRGILPGDRIAIASTNRAEWAYLFFAAAKIGLPVVALSVRYRELELDHMLNQAQVRLVVTPTEADGFDFVSFYESFRRRVPTLEHVVFLDGAGFAGATSFEDLATTEIDRSALAAAAGPVEADSPMLIAFTSGTTGVPKGAVLTHRNLLTTVSSMVELLGLDDRDTFVGSLPLSHVGGIICGPLGALLSGSELVLMSAFTSDGALRIIDSNRATVFFGAPTMYATMLDRAGGYDISSLRHAIIGTSNAPPALCERIAAALPAARLSNIYGLTESSGFSVATRSGDDLATIARTIGVPMDHVEARVVNADGLPVQPGEAGELQIRGAGVCDGYWQAPEETAATFLPGGWLATGDAVSPEPNGHLALRGRIKEMFIRGGFNVYPVEIENLLTTHPAVAVVAGIGVPDPVLGEVGRYYVVAAPAGDAPEPDVLKLFCRDRVADYKVPDQIVLVEELPLTAIGKIDKRALKRRAAEEAQHPR